jgi:type II secretory pathway pseudopilin PulG
MKPKLIAAVLVGIGLGLAMPFFAKQQDAAAQQQKDQKWEYKVEQFGAKGSVDGAKAQLNNLANDGWEYVGLVATPYGGGGGGFGGGESGWVAFKRLKK